MPYQQIKLDLTPAQQKKALKGLAFRLNASQIGKGQVVLVSRANYKKIQSAKAGVMLDLAPGEVIATASYHKLIPDMSGDMSGSGIFDTIWSGIKSAGKWLKDSGIASTLADAAIPAVSGVLGPAGALVARKIVKDTTGVGIARKTRKKAISGSGLYI
jgi:hypothetical protein